MADDFTILAEPRIRQGTFITILRDRRSPAAAEGKACWDGIVAHGVDPALALAIFQHESSFGTKGAAKDRRNWGNLRKSPKFPDDGRFVVYPTWADGARDAARLLARYGRNEIRPGTNTKTAQTFPFVWAPSADGNRPDVYGNEVVASMNRFIALDKADESRPAERLRFEAAFDDVRIRSGPRLAGALVRKVDKGVVVIARRTVRGDRYETEGMTGDTWLEIVEIAGKAVNPAAFSASVLWRRA